jgi:hypothetical protein
MTAPATTRPAIDPARRAEAVARAAAGLVAPQATIAAAMLSIRQAR